jgi:hypothetical protein
MKMTDEKDSKSDIENPYSVKKFFSIEGTVCRYEIPVIYEKGER